jgi:hypothetical protein
MAGWRVTARRYAGEVEKSLTLNSFLSSTSAGDPNVELKVDDLYLRDNQVRSDLDWRTSANTRSTALRAGSGPST